MAARKAKIDKQVQSILAEYRKDVKKRGAGLAIAKLYMTKKDYVTAKRYVEGFLQDESNNPEGHELLAEIHEALGDKKNALKSYKIALESGGSRYRRLLLKISELVCDIESDVIILQYWLSECEKEYPKSCTAVRLKAHIHNMSRSENSATAKSQLDMHLDLISSYTSSNQYVLAYDAAFTINKETKFQDDLLWFEQVQYVFMEYGELWSEMKKDRNYNLQYLYILRNYAYLCMGTSDVEDCVFAVQSFDKQLKNALELKFNDTVMEFNSTRIQGSTILSGWCIIA
ncbi:RANBP2-like and GRIP domain-containing protein 2 [Physella acuta]|uniref:RANBP2-like and GRIP domain-containing protein 2 n=1 Tax=Physella acuta TaxID=109671 RepID=UPI0027DE65ED|nr:RANBP2-like and GRIP domain-containing protein 2 [Physella acuta]